MVCYLYIYDMIVKFIEYIKEYSETEFYILWDEYDSVYYDQLTTLIDNVVDKDLKTQPWRVVPFQRIKKIWTDWSRLNFIRDEKGMNMIADIVINNIVKLDINTMLAGHTPYNPKDELEERDVIFKLEEDEDPNQMLLFPDNKQQEVKREEDKYRLPITFEEFEERLDDYLYDEEWGQYRISDYALEPLQKLALDLILSKTPEEKLLLCDRVFNIVHPRGDIASLFVKGGSDALSELSS